MFAPFVLLALTSGAAFQKGPYLQNVAKDGVTVMWETTSAVGGRVTVQAPGEKPRVVEGGVATQHEVRIEGLAPGRRYHYTVESGGQSDRGELTTAPRADEAFAFVVFGDSRSNVDMHRSVVERVRREVPDFILGTGDMVNEGGVQADWQQFFDIERELLKENVLYPSLGNHDRQGPRRSADNYKRYFATPQNSPEPERYYAFTYGNSRFLVLDSNSSSFALTDQTAWMTRELERAASDKAIRHIFVSMHHPPYSVSLHGGQPELREMWTPIFEKYGVDAVFSGHDHVYGRAEANQVNYFVSGGGGAPLYPRDKSPAKLDVEANVYFERTLNFLRVQVVGDFVEVTAVRDDGTLIESLSWGQRPELPLVAAYPAQPTAAASPEVASAGAARAHKACAVAAGGPTSDSTGLLFVAGLALAGYAARRRSRT